MPRAPAEVPFIPTTLSELTPEFLTQALRDAGALATGSVQECKAEQIGQGYGFACDVARLHLTYSDPNDAGPPTLVAKLPTANLQNRAGLEALGGYEREVCFAKELSEHSLLPLPRCYYAEMDADPNYERRPAGLRMMERLPVWLFRVLVPLGIRFSRVSKRRYLILIEDLAPARNGDQVAGCTPAEALGAVRGLAAFHASYWADESLPSKIWLPPPSSLIRAYMAVHRSFRQRFFRLHPEAPAHMQEACRWMDTHCEQVMALLSAAPYTVLHGDYRLDNLFFATDRILAIDFQIVQRGRPGLDLAYFIAGSVDSDVELTALLDAYSEQLAAYGISDYSRAECERDYTLGMLFQTYMHIPTEGNVLDLGGERGEKLIEAMRRRLYSRIPRPPYDDLL